MKTGGTSSLNPYAASYVPIFKREAADLYKEIGSAQVLSSGNEVGQFVNSFLQGPHENSSKTHPKSVGATQTADLSKPKDDRSNEFVASTSQYPNEVEPNANFAVDFEMDLAYLQMSFPGISHQSLSDVYQANSCDLDSAIDMLEHLEANLKTSSDTLPDTLDIGDVPESGTMKAAPGEAKNATAAASTSASKS